MIYKTDCSMVVNTTAATATATTTATTTVVVAPTATATATATATTNAMKHDQQEQQIDDALSIQLRSEALEIEKNEPELSSLLRRTILAPHVQNFEDAVAHTVAYRLLGSAHSNSADMISAMFSPCLLLTILQDAFKSKEETELGHTMSGAVRLDVLAIQDRDPACNTILEVVLFFKGFAALVAHRAARQKWYANKSSISSSSSSKISSSSISRNKSMTALFLQSQASAVFGVDIHPAATIGAGILLDHATGIVIGETAVVGNNCTILHGVTLGGTGKESGDRHPKVGNDVLIGANASLLGNVSIGDNVQIGAGSIVLQSIPSGSTAVGVPAKVIGRITKEFHAGQDVDTTLKNVDLQQKKVKENCMKKQTSNLSFSCTSTTTLTTTSSTITSDDETDFENDDGLDDEYVQHRWPDDDKDDDMPSPICQFRALTQLRTRVY